MTDTGSTKKPEEAVESAVAEVSEQINKTELNGSEDEEDEPSKTEAQTEKKKKKKKKSKKKKKIGPIDDIYPEKNFPEGQTMKYTLDFDTNLKRTTEEEERYLSRRFTDEKLRDFRKGAEIHRRVRRHARNNFKPGMSMLEVASTVEDTLRKYVNCEDTKVAGIGFPTGLSLNDVAAHYTPNSSDKLFLHEDDVMKVDIGVHVNGRIVDCAFTHTFNHKYDGLLEAVKAATNTGIKEAGIDVRMCDIGEAIQEVMESHEVELDGKLYPVKCLRNLNGHNIGDFHIHDGKTVPIVKNEDETKMEEHETFAIETFGSIKGYGFVLTEGECSHYAKNPTASLNDVSLQSAKQLYKVIDKNFGTLPFCRRYLDRIGQEKYLFSLNNLVKAGVVEDYPPLVEKKGAYTAQFEHTILLRPEYKEVVSRGDDY